MITNQSDDKKMNAGERLSVASVNQESNPDSFFQNTDGEMEYCEKCLSCKRSCKQSFRITNLICRKYVEKP